MQWLALWTLVDIPLRIVGEGGGAKVRGALIPVRQWHVGVNAGIFQRPDVVHGAVGRMANRAFRTKPPAEADPPQQVEHRGVLRDVSRRDQRLELRHLAPEPAEAWQRLLRFVDW